MYIPAQRDIVWLNFDPSTGKEIKKRRPALVVSKSKFNKQTGFCIVCPITSTNRDYLTYVPIKFPKLIHGEVVTHQIRSVDFSNRKIEKIEKIDDLTWVDVLDILKEFI